MSILMLVFGIGIGFLVYRSNTAGELVGKMRPMDPEMGRMDITVRRNVIGIRREARVVVGSPLSPYKRLQFNPTEAVRLADLLETAAGKVSR